MTSLPDPAVPDGIEPRRAVRARREPPAFRPVTVRRVEGVTARMRRVTLAGPSLEGLVVDQPAASVRVLLPSPGSSDLVMPAWNGNEFLLPDGSRPTLRTFTPLRVDPEALELDIDVVLHGRGPAVEWAAVAGAGSAAAVSGPGRGYEIDWDAPAYVLAGDETAIPAIGQLLAALSAGTGPRPVQVHIEVGAPGGRGVLPEHSEAAISWWDRPAGVAPGDALVTAVRGADITADTRVWAAGEAAAVQRIRRYLFEERGLPRARATVRGYWKNGSAGDDV